MTIRLKSNKATPRKRTPDELRFDALLEQVRDRKGRCFVYDEKMLKKYVEWYEMEIMESLIPQAMGMDWLRPQEWQLLARLYKTYGIAKVEKGIERLAGRKNYSIDMLEKILKTPSLATRKDPNASPEPARPLRSSDEYPPKDHYYTQYDTQRWLTEHDKSPIYWADYFEFINGNRFLLKSEYR